MRFVCISDTHDQLDFMKDIPEGDVLIHSGDATNRGTEQELKRFNEHLGELPHPYKIFVPGNHDKGMQVFPEYRKLITNAIVLMDEEVTIEGIRIWGSPWTPRFFDWAFMLEGAKISKKWAAIPTGIDILITHGPPYSYLDFNRHKAPCGCPHLKREVETRIKPRYHIFGHIHEGAGTAWNKDTHFINASSCDGWYNPVNRPICFGFTKNPPTAEEPKVDAYKPLVVE